MVAGAISLWISRSLGAFVQESITAYTVVKLAGAANLVFLGLQTFRHRGSPAAALDARVEPRLLRRILADGFVVGMFNTKVIVFFMAVLPSWLVSSPRRLAAIGGTGGLVIAGLGAGLAVSGRPKI